MTEKAYICERCDERITDEGKLIFESDPDLWKHPLREVCLKIREQNGDPTPSRQYYHERRAFNRLTRCTQSYLCGPIHPETEQEYFIHWIGYGMKPDTDSY